jgi:hypothetical protein
MNTTLPLPAIFQDGSHYSAALEKTKYYRICLPPDYAASGKRYPVIYWYHGYSGTYQQETYTADFESFVQSNDVLIVAVDGGWTTTKITWDYYLAFEERPKDIERYHNRYFRELAAEIDSKYRTIPDRDHRAVSGQSMGGHMGPYIACQNQDLIGSASTFCPSCDAAMIGPPNQEVHFPTREMHRSLKGIPIRINSPVGDRYKQYNWELKAAWEMADLTHLEFHEPNHPDHRAADMPQGFAFHMKEFAKTHPAPQNWHHADPFPEFTVRGYAVSAVRPVPALTLLENVTPGALWISSRPYLPDGPLTHDEKINVATDSIYGPEQTYTVTGYNRTGGAFAAETKTADARGRLHLCVSGGGHILGINTARPEAKVFLVPADNRECRFAEAGQDSTLLLTVVNVGSAASGPI